MMKRYLIVVAGVAVLTMVGWYAYTNHTNNVTLPVAKKTTPSAIAAIAKESDQRSIPTEVQQKIDYAEFQEQTRDFFDHEKELSATEREQRAQQIDKQTGQFQQQGFLSASEALVLKLAILKLTLDSSAFEQQGRALIEQYKKDYDVAYQQWLTTPDPQFEAYKVQEAEIVKRVMAMNSFPNGLSRDEYLRRELERARIAAYQQP